MSSESLNNAKHLLGKDLSTHRSSTSKANSENNSSTSLHISGVKNGELIQQTLKSPEAIDYIEEKPLKSCNYDCKSGHYEYVCSCEYIHPKKRAKACSLTLETANHIVNYNKANLRPHEPKRSLSISVPRAQTAHPAVPVRVEPSFPQPQYEVSTRFRTPSIHISENPLESHTCSTGGNILWNNCACAHCQEEARRNSTDSIGQCTMVPGMRYHMQTPEDPPPSTSTPPPPTGSRYSRCANGSPTPSCAPFIALSQGNVHVELSRRRSTATTIASGYGVRSPSIADGRVYAPVTCVQPPGTSGLISEVDSRQISCNPSRLPSRQPSAQSMQQTSSCHSGPTLAVEGARTKRLFSVGPTFHIQLAQPRNFDWNQRSALEKKLFCLLCGLALLFTIFLGVSHLGRTWWEEHRNSQKTKPFEVCMSPFCVKTASSLLSSMDLTVNPCDNFYKFACGGWDRSHFIPDDRPGITAYDMLADNIQAILRDILEEPVSAITDNSGTTKAKHFYKACMNKDKEEEIKDTPLREWIQNAGGWPVVQPNWTNQDWSAEKMLGKLKHDFFYGSIIETYVSTDDKNSSSLILVIDQAKLGLYGKEHYTQPDGKLRDAYLKLMINVATIMGAEESHAKQEMKKVLDFEIKLANLTKSEQERQDPTKLYNKQSLKNMQTLTPDFQWLTYYNEVMPTKVQIQDDEQVLIYALAYIKEATTLIKQTPPRVIQNYAVWRVVYKLLSVLGNEYTIPKREFRKVLVGASEERARWFQCADITNKKFGPAVGHMFIRDHFNHQSKENVHKMISYLINAFNTIISTSDWLDEETKDLAKQKTAKIGEGIGYPDFITNSIEVSKETDRLPVYEGQFLLNYLNTLKFENEKFMERLRVAPQKDRWFQMPAVVNAFYNPSTNNILFPAGIFQPNFYSRNYPTYLNFGGIGVVIGHEITHAFDERGRLFDKDGNVKKWWKNETEEKFRNRAQCIIDQYSSYVVEEVKMNINGMLTQGENIADNGGLKAAFMAYKKYASENDLEPVLPGFNMTHEQLFFLNFAQIWCGKLRPEELQNKVRHSTHPPGAIRVIGPISNSIEFSKSFNCPIGTRMNPVKKCSLW